MTTDEGNEKKLLLLIEAITIITKLVFENQIYYSGYHAHNTTYLHTTQCMYLYVI